MIALRPAAERGKADFGWLDSRHTFSFGDYYDPRHMGFGPLRVINEDRVEPARGFGTHGHRDMEIISYVLDGALEHKDSIGTGSVIGSGEVQIMSAGTGIRHSEFNHSQTDPVHFLQIWVPPDRQGLFPDSGRRGHLRLVGSPDAPDGSVLIYQDLELYNASLACGEKVAHSLRRGRRAWVQVVRGRIEINGRFAGAGDGVAIEAEPELAIKALDDGAELLVFDLP